MNIANATTEPLYSFVKFHDALNRRVKTTTAALKATDRAIGSGTTSPKLLSVLIEYAGEPWGTKNHMANPSEEMKASATFFSEMAVVRVDSAFEDFLTSILDEWKRLLAKGWTTTAPPAQGARKTVAGGHDKNLARCRGFGFDLAVISAVTPLHEYLSLLRNSIVHRNARPSPALIAHAGSAAFIQAWGSFRVARKKAPPEPPAMDADRIFLLPRHVIFLSAVCRVIATHVNAAFRTAAGVDGLVFLASRHSLSSVPISTSESKPRSPEALMNRYLMSGRGVKPATTSEVIGVMKSKKLQIWDDYRKSFAKF